MNYKKEVEKLAAIIPHRYQLEAFAIIKPHFSPEMAAAVEEYIDKFKAQPLAHNEIIELIFKLVQELTGADNIKASRSRHASILIPRQIAIYALYQELPNFGLQRIGNIFEHRYNHATVLNAKNSVEGFYQTSAKFREELNRLAHWLEESGLTGLKSRLSILKVI